MYLVCYLFSPVRMMNKGKTVMTKGVVKFVRFVKPVKDTMNITRN